MSYVPDSSQLRGLSYPVASLYGMPHVGARYFRDDVDATKWDGAARRCAACGKAGGFHSRHHEPPKSRGRTFLLCTPVGRFVLKPALIDLCGTGTTGCHGARHGGRLRIRWAWDGDEHAEAWWSGRWLSLGMPPNGAWLFEFGRYVVEARGPAGTWTARHEVRGGFREQAEG